MRTAIDTNVLSALWSKEPLSMEAASLLGEARREGGLVISAPVCADLAAHPKVTLPFIDGFLERTNILVEFVPVEAVWREAAGCFAEYARRRRRSRSDAP